MRFDEFALKESNSRIKSRNIREQSRPPKSPLPRAPGPAELARYNRELQAVTDPADPTGALKQMQDITAQMRAKEQELNDLTLQLQSLKANASKNIPDPYGPPQDATNTTVDPRNPKNWVGRTPTGNPMGGGPISQPLRESTGLMFKGYPCTVDCSGHRAGYYWAKLKGITNAAACPITPSNSFYEGCLSAASGQ